jgi:branched-subunit amino acid aminotransferase/4-amino-4-deoxychorismate lyase
VEASLADTIPVHAKAAGLYMICTMSKHAAEAKGCSDALFMDYRGYVAEATGANIFFVKDGEVHTPTADVFLNGITRQTVIGMLEERQVKVHERTHHARRAGKLRAMLADRHGGGGHPGGADRRLQLRGRRDDPGRVDGV